MSVDNVRSQFGGVLGINQMEFWCELHYKSIYFFPVPEHLLSPEHLLAPTTSEAKWKGNRLLTLT